MVSRRCKMAVKSELEHLGIYHSNVQLGKISLNENVDPKKIIALKIILKKYGFDIIDSKKNILVEKIKTLIIEKINTPDFEMEINFSDYLSKEMNYSYPYLTSIFSEIEANTIEHFIIEHKIERVKAMLEQGEFNLTEIAYELDYSSVAHLSYQFKKITGLTPTNFKTLTIRNRRTLENI